MENQLNFIPKYPNIKVVESGMVSDGVDTKVRTAITYVRKKINGQYYFMEIRIDSRNFDEAKWCNVDMPRFFNEVTYVLYYDYTNKNVNISIWGNGIILDTNQED